MLTHSSLFLFCGGTVHRVPARGMQGYVYFMIRSVISGNSVSYIKYSSMSSMQSTEQGWPVAILSTRVQVVGDRC